MRYNLEARFLDLQPVNQILQFAGAVLLTGQAVVISGCPEELHNQPLRIADGLGIRSDLHAGADRHTAGGHQRSGAFHFDDTDPAGADIGRFAIMAQGRNINSVYLGHAQDRLPWIGLYVKSVDLYHNLFIVHIDLLAFYENGLNRSRLAARYF